MTTRRRRILLWIGIGLPSAALLAIAVFLATFDGSRYRSTVERLVGRATGRRCTIGKFEVDLSLHPRLLAERVTLANAAWSATPSMLTLERLDLELDAWSILSPPLHVRRLELSGVDVSLEVDPASGANWKLEPVAHETRTSDAGGTGFLAKGLVLDDVTLRDVEVAYRGTTRARTIVIERLVASTDVAGNLAVDAHGRMADADLGLTARVGPLQHLWAGGEIEIDARGRIDDASVTLAGSLGDLRELSAPALRFELRGDALETLARHLDLPALGAGPYRLDARTTPGDHGVDVVVEADLDRLDGRLDGRVDRLARPSRAEASVTARVPDLAHLGEWIGVERLPNRPLSASGRIAWASGATTTEDLRLEIGRTKLTADGHVGAWPDMAGTDLRFDLSGPDLAAWSAPAGLDLPAIPFRGSGRIRRDAAGLSLEGVGVDLGDNRFRADGAVSTRPGLVGSDLTVEGSGPSAAVIGGYFGVDLPDAPFAVGGEARREAGATVLSGFEARVGETELRAEGTLGDPPGLAGTDLALHAAGPDLAAVGAAAGVALPAGSFSLGGRVRRRPEGYGFSGMTVRLNDASAEGDGYVDLGPGGPTIAVDGRAAGPDLAALLGHALEPEGGDGLALPAEPFDVRGAFRMDGVGYHVDAVHARLGDAGLELTGSVGRRPAIDPLDVTFSAHAGSLALLAGHVDLPPLPVGTVEVAGRVTSTEGVYALHEVRGALGGNRFDVDGSVGRLEDFPAGVDATFAVEGPDLAAFAALTPGVELPALAFGASGHVTVEEDSYRLGEVTLRLGTGRLTADGVLGPPPEFPGTDLRVEADGLLLAWIAGPTGHAWPAMPARLTGRIVHDDRGFELSGFEAATGEHRFVLQGRIGEPPGLDGTSFSLEASGPSLADWAATTGESRLPAEPYELSAKLEGTPDSFALTDLSVRVGPSDLTGSMTLDRRPETPKLTGNLVSRLLDLRAFLPAPEAPSDHPPPEAEEKEAKQKRVFSDEPLDLSALGRVDADVRFGADRIRLPARELSSVELILRTREGVLDLDRFAVVGAGGGRLSGAFSVTPQDPGYRVSGRLRGDELRLGILSGETEDPALIPPTSLNVALTSVGSSPRELASSLNGHVWMIQGPGRVEGAALGLLSFDLLYEILDVLNPFSDEDPTANLECAVALVTAKDGLARIEALALRTDKLTLGGHGTIDLKNEELDVRWSSKVRKGVGLSASAITNSYVKLGGSLGDPRVEIKPLEAAVTTGAAVATAGVSLVARGLWDRVTAGKNPCKKGMKEIEKLMAGETEPDPED